MYYRKLNILFILFCLWHPLFSQITAYSFDELLSQLQALEVPEQNEAIENFLKEKAQTPIIEENQVIFLAKGDLQHAPRIMADFNGFLNSRYVENPEAWEMSPIGNTNWYFFKKELKSDAIINYRFQLGDKIMTDPLNPQARFSFGTLFSVVHMADFKIPSETVLDFSIPRGKVHYDSISSSIFGKTRQIQVYLPFGYESLSDLPTLYLHDGLYYIDNAKIPQILDKLIAQQQIQPLIAVFDNPFIRGKEYRGDDAYSIYLKDELIPFIENQFRTSTLKENRAVIGGSRGGMSALYVSYGLDLFSKCGAFSPAIHPKTVEEFTSELKSKDFQPNTIFISGALYDHIWYKDALELKTIFENQNLEFHYLEQSTGHNIPAWRTLVDEMLMAFFPFRN